MMFFQDVLWGALKIVVSFMGACAIVFVITAFIAVVLGGMDVSRYKYQHNGREYRMLPRKREPSRLIQFGIGMSVLLIWYGIGLIVWDL